MHMLLLPVPSSNCLACEYVASCAALTTIARTTVGPQPWGKEGRKVVKEKDRRNRGGQGEGEGGGGG